jgi:hypothetical protein
MEPPLSMEKVTRKRTREPRRAFCFLLFSFALCLAGCINTGAFVVPGIEWPSAGPCEAVVAWNPEVVYRPDPANRGTPAPGLGGRMYLFGEGSDCPLAGDGCVVVDLYEKMPLTGDTSPVPLEEWRFDRATLKRLLRRDAVGWGYTLFLPWGTYKPEIKEVELRLRYEPVKGAPLYAEVSSVVFHKGGPPIVVHKESAGTPVASRSSKTRKTAESAE